MVQTSNKTIILPSGYQKPFLGNTYEICSTEQNEKGRTSCVTYVVIDRVVHIIHGEQFSEEELYCRKKELEKAMEPFVLESKRKRFQAEQEVSKIIIF